MQWNIFDMRIRYKHKLFTGFFIILILVLFIFYLFTKNNSNFISTAKSVEHTNEILYQSEQIISAAKDIETGVRGFIINGNETFLEPFYKGKDNVYDAIEKLHIITLDNPTHQKRIDSLNKVIHELIALNIKQIRLKKASPALSEEQFVILVKGQNLMDSARHITIRTQQEEAKLLVGMYSDNKQSLTITRWLVYILGAVIALLLLLALYLLLKSFNRREKADQLIQELNTGLEKQVLRRTAELEESNKELESFSYSVSHDLRAPLRAIDGYTRALKDDYGDKLDAEGNRLLQVVMKNALKMGSLIDDLLAFSRFGKQSLFKAPINMKELVYGVINDLQVVQPQNAIRFTVQELINVQADSNMIRQVLMNLISNAIKYSSKTEKPVIEIGSFVEGPNIAYYIKDNGVGFDMQYYDKLFGVFQRLHSSKEFEGTGVGLATVKRIITRHDGTIRANSVIGEGATFIFSLPK